MEASEDARNIADVTEPFAEFAEVHGVGEEFADEGGAALDLGEVEGGGGEPAFEEARAGGGAGAVDGGEKRAVAGAARGLKDLQVAQRGGVEEERARAAVFLERAEVFRFGAEVFGRVVDERAGGAEGGVVVGEAKTLEVEHAEGGRDGAEAFGGFEVVAGEIGAETRLAKGVERVDGGLVVRGGFPAFEVAFDDDQFRRVEGGEDGEEVFGAGVGGDFEFAGGEIEPSGVESGFVEGERAEVVVALGVELVGREGGAGREDAGDGALDEFAGFGGLGLIADGDFFAGGEELGDVVIRGVVGYARHGRFAALGEGESAEFRHDGGVVEEHLVEVAEAEEQDRVAGESAFHLEVLLHHRGEFLGSGRHGVGANHETREIHEKIPRADGRES